MLPSIFVESVSKRCLQLLPRVVFNQLAFYLTSCYLGEKMGWIFRTPSQVSWYAWNSGSLYWWFCVVRKTQFNCGSCLYTLLCFRSIMKLYFIVLIDGCCTPNGALIFWVTMFTTGKQHGISLHSVFNIWNSTKGSVGISQHYMSVIDYYLEIVISILVRMNTCEVLSYDCLSFSYLGPTGTYSHQCICRPVSDGGGRYSGLLWPQWIWLLPWKFEKIFTCKL